MPKIIAVKNIPIAVNNTTEPLSGGSFVGRINES